MLYEITNTDNGMQSKVHSHAKGFSVVLQDLDSGEFVPVVKIFADKERAVAYAREIVGE